MIQLQATDPVVWQFTKDAAVNNSSIAPSLTVHCKACQGLLAEVGITAAGPMFRSGWVVEKPLGREYVVNGKRLSRRAALRHEAETALVVRESGPPIVDEERHGTMALLVLPAGMVEDYPPLLVRCVRHGDAIVDRSAVIEATRANTPKMFIEVAMPRLDYDVESFRASIESDPLTTWVESTTTRRLARQSGNGES